MELTIGRIDFTSEEMNLIVDDSGKSTYNMSVIVPLRLDKEEFYLMLLKSESSDWQPGPIKKVIDEGLTDVTNQFQSDVRERVYYAVLNNHLITKGLIYMDEVYLITRADIESSHNHPVYRQGLEICRKINKEIHCGFNYHDGQLIFVIPNYEEPLFYTVNYEEIFTKYDTEDEFIQKAIYHLKKLKEDYEQKMKK